MEYIELRCYFSRDKELASEILTAELAEIGFESFVDEDDALMAYIQAGSFDFDEVNNLEIVQNPLFEISFDFKKIEDQNWNEVWERNYYEPLIVNDELLIRGSFHADTPKLKYEIIIDPKMSFGTGHHETTSMVLEEIFNIDVKGKKILDMGCGTSVLAIFASMRGAKEILAIDVDHWAWENSLENIKTNGIENIAAKQGDVNDIDGLFFDIIFANINKNILLNDIPAYGKSLKKGGELIISGFYTNDLQDINKVAKNANLKIVSKREKRKWMAAHFMK